MRKIGICAIAIVLLLSGCTGEPVELNAMRADIVALEQEVSALREQNLELTEAVNALRGELQGFYDLMLDAAEQSTPTEAAPQEAASPEPTPSPQIIASPLPVETLETEQDEGHGQPVSTPQTQESAQPPEQTPQPAIQISRSIYVTPTGSRYHYDSACNGGSYAETTLEDALGRGLTPCGRCAEG